MDDTVVSGKDTVTDNRILLAYLGGSLTNGGNASDPESGSWRALTTRWYRDQYPDRQVECLNLAVSGTGSDFAAFRLRRDLGAADPHITFVEFAVNDTGLPPGRIARGIEGVVRYLRRHTQSQIVLVYTTSAYGPPTAAAVHDRVAQHYGIPVIDAGQALHERVAAGDTWDQLVPDGYHPLDEGHAVYASAVIDNLDPGWIRKGAQTPLPAALNSRCYSNARTVSFAKHSVDKPDPPSEVGMYVGDDWKESSLQSGGRTIHFVEADRPGAEIHVTLSGFAAGLSWLVAPDSGEIEWQIDGSPWQRINTWTQYASKWPMHLQYTLIAGAGHDDLSKGAHEIRIRVSPVVPEGSTGTVARLVDVLVAEEERA